MCALELVHVMSTEAYRHTHTHSVDDVITHKH